MSLRDTANEYHKQANAVAAKGDAAGGLTPGQRAAVEGYRAAAARVEALIGEEAGGATGATWRLEGNQSLPDIATKAVTTRDKAATPQELIKKAK